MSARGLLENPALFAGEPVTPLAAVDKFIGHTMQSPLPYGLVLHHISEMSRKILTRAERATMMESSTSMLELIDWLDVGLWAKRDKLKQL